MTEELSNGEKEEKMKASSMIALTVTVAAFAAFAAQRTGPWTPAQAWEWYNAQPWIRGCNYMPASSSNRYDMWQVWDCERRFEEMDRELALAESIGFNAVRVIIAEDNGFAVWCEDHDGYMRNLERFLALCGKHKIRAIMCLGNDCSRPKPLWSVPKPGPQPYDIGYHGGRKQSQHGSFPGMIGYISADDPELRPKFFKMCGEVMEKYKDDDRVLFWNIWNEPGNNNRGKVSAPLVKEMFELAWKIGVKHPCAADLWRGKLEPNLETAEGIAAAWSDIISFHITPLDAAWKLQIVEGHWGPTYASICSFGNDTEGGKFTEYDLDANKGYFSIEVTQEMLDAAFTQQWWGGVFVLNGDNVVVDRITTTHYESLETTVWEGNVVADDWGNQPTFFSDGGAELLEAGMKVGSVIRIYITPTADGWNCQLWDGHWHGQFAGCDFNNGNWNLDEHNGAVEFTVTDDFFARMTASEGWGGAFLVNGDNVICTKVTIE